MPKKAMTHPNFFDYMNQLFYKNRKYPYDKKIASAYLLSMWLSHDPGLIGIVHKINRLQFYVPDDIIYEYYFNRVPKGRRYIKWSKKTPEEKARKKFIDEVVKETKLSKREASMIYEHKRRLNK